MNIIANPERLRGFEGRIKVEKISRRSVLKNLGIAGALVLAAPVMSRQAFAAYQTGAGAMPHCTVVDPRVFVAIASDGIRQPGYRWIAQHTALSDADAPDRRLGARDAGSRSRQTMGRAGHRGEGGEP
jgi:hypothetical protein